MLLSSALKVAIFLVCTTLVISQGIAQERVPSGDLSDFFNPPGVKSENLNSTTRKIGKEKKPVKKDAVTTATTKTEAAKSDATKTDPSSPKAGERMDTTPAVETEPKPPAPPRSKSENNSGQVKIVAEELGAIEGGISFGKPTKTNWRVGLVMVTGSKAVKDVICRIPVPTQWPEQTVTVYEENLPSEITAVGWEDLGNIKMMKCRIGDVPPGTKVVATVTFTVSTSQIIGPKNTSIFRIPEKRVREIKPYFGESPEISLRNTKMKKQAKVLFDNMQSDWIKVQNIYDWVRENIEERAGDAKGSVETFLTKFGNAEDRVSLFVAMCRINKIPARMVFVDGSQYAEFYMVDDKEQGHWFPCKVSGIREFGSIGEPRVILQKGDNYRVPGEKKKLKYVPAKATVKGGSPPRLLKFAREPLSVK